MRPSLSPVQTMEEVAWLPWGELMRIIPSMDLDHAVVVVLFDAEDQGTSTDWESWAEGSRRWADNLSNVEVSNLKAFVLLDMIGDAHLNLANITSNHQGLNNAVEPLAQALGLIQGREACSGVEVKDVYQPGNLQYIFDDHVRLLNVGVPAIDIIDHRFWAERDRVRQHSWHTLEGHARQGQRRFLADGHAPGRIGPPVRRLDGGGGP